MGDWELIMQASFPYVFGSAAKNIFKDFCSKEAQKISNFFQVSWTQFAKTGSPSSDLINWTLMVLVNRLRL
jgi:carboxylesterase type B